MCVVFARQTDGSETCRGLGSGVLVARMGMRRSLPRFEPVRAGVFPVRVLAKHHGALFRDVVRVRNASLNGGASPGVCARSLCTRESVWSSALDRGPSCTRGRVAYSGLGVDASRQSLAGVQPM